MRFNVEKAMTEWVFINRKKLTRFELEKQQDISDKKLVVE